MSCKHYWKNIGYYDSGFGISSSCIVQWCTICGSFKKNYKIVRPQIVKKKQEEPKSFSFPITDTNIIKELDSLTQEQVEELNRILEEGLKELREKR